MFIPQGEPWRNGVVEHYNDTFDKRFFRSERFDSRAAPRSRAGEFERFHNDNHRYRATGRRTPAEMIGTSVPRQPTPLAELPTDWPAQGQVEFIRFIRSDRKPHRPPYPRGRLVGYQGQLAAGPPAQPRRMGQLQPVPWGR